MAPKHPAHRFALQSPESYSMRHFKASPVIGMVQDVCTGAFKMSRKNADKNPDKLFDKDLLHNLITDNGIDLSWLETHPPQTFGGGQWSGSGWESVVDSELILLLVMKKINLLGDNIEGFKAAVSDLVNAGVNAGQLNLIFSNGYSLLIFGG